ncbi:hypothetical protein VXF94_21435 (plasmid) [Bacillus amyloliquefaciens]|uniref:hypothetical protein n=1 Tax=Bacillus amyloliquefaciens TaxID=1390 RepID=UPI002EDA571E
MKSPRLIEAAGQPDSGAGRVPALCPGRQRAALAAAEGDPLRPATASAHGALLRAKREKARRAYHGAPEPIERNRLFSPNKKRRLLQQSVFFVIIYFSEV